METSRRGFIGGIIASIAGSQMVVNSDSTDLSKLIVEEPVVIHSPWKPESWIMSGYVMTDIFHTQVGEQVFNKKGQVVGVVSEITYQAFVEHDLIKNRVDYDPKKRYGVDGYLMPIAKVALQPRKK